MHGQVNRGCGLLPEEEVEAELDVEELDDEEDEGIEELRAGP